MRLETIPRIENTPLLLEEIKSHLRIDHGEEDAYLARLLDASVDVAEAYTNRFLAERRVLLWLDNWTELRHANVQSSPWWDGVQDGAFSHHLGSVNTYSLNFGPIQKINEVTIYEADGTPLLVAEGTVQLTPGLPARLYLADGQSWPTPERKYEGICLHLTVGYGESWNHIPSLIRQSLLQHISHMYAYRGDEIMSGSDMNGLKACGAAALLKTYKKMRVA